MFISLFASFDPYVAGLPLNWLSSFGGIPLIITNAWLMYSQASWSIKLILMMVTSELSSIMDPSKSLYFVTLFVFLCLNNLMGLLPYVFTASTHPIFGLSFAFSFWLMMMMFSMKHQPIYMLAHLVPTGTPSVLKPFMVMIELTSNIIRPITLTIRLTANMMAGHLLLTLIGSAAPSYFLFYSLIMVGILLITLLELGVAFIQGYVFSVLLILYFAEMDSITMNKSL